MARLLPGGSNCFFALLAMTGSGVLPVSYQSDQSTGMTDGVMIRLRPVIIAMFDCPSIHHTKNYGARMACMTLWLSLIKITENAAVTGEVLSSSILLRTGALPPVALALHPRQCFNCYDKLARIFQ
jgi:hypothetical protein